MSDMTFASLSPTLLARKGGAKPAMRRQSVAVAGAEAHQPTQRVDALEDLGWNDLGDDDANGLTAPVATPHANDSGDEREADDAAFAPLASHARSTATTREDTPGTTDTVTPIRKGAPRLPRPTLAASTPAPATGSGVSAPAGKRAAFTLRLDAQRHLKLRMASTLAGRSAQSLVTEAVDAMFAATPELDALVARVHSRPHKEG